MSVDEIMINGIFRILSIILVMCFIGVCLWMGATAASVGLEAHPQDNHSAINHALAEFILMAILAISTTMIGTFVAIRVIIFTFELMLKLWG